MRSRVTERLTEPINERSVGLQCLSGAEGRVGKGMGLIRGVWGVLESMSLWDLHMKEGNVHVEYVE